MPQTQNGGAKPPLHSHATEGRQAAHCYAQISGLGVATFVTLLLAPLLYSIFVLDLKIVKWEGADAGHAPENPASPKGELA